MLVSSPSFPLNEPELDDMQIPLRTDYRAKTSDIQASQHLTKLNLKSYATARQRAKGSCSAHTAADQPSRLLRNVKVKQYIDKRNAELAERPAERASFSRTGKN